MAISPDTSPTLTRCSRCGQPFEGTLTACPGCGFPNCTPPPCTHQLDHAPTVTPHRGQRRIELGPHRRVILQSLPSGTCFPLDAAGPVILGRGESSSGRALLDLSAIRAYEHGVSRFHCLIQPYDPGLDVMDLGSRNGTYLNDYPLLPLRRYPLAHGDKLILGTLHLLLFFD